MFGWLSLIQPSPANVEIQVTYCKKKKKKKKKNTARAFGSSKSRQYRTGKTVEEWVETYREQGKGV